MAVPLAAMPRYRCAACGNLTRFDVVTTRRTRAFHHYTVGGELQVEDEELLDEQVDRILADMRRNGPIMQSLVGLTAKLVAHSDTDVF